MSVDGSVLVLESNTICHSVPDHSIISFSLATSVSLPPLSFQASAPSVLSVEPISPSNNILLPGTFKLVGLVLVGSIIASIVPFCGLFGNPNTVLVGIVSSSQLTISCVSSKSFSAIVPTTGAAKSILFR